MSYPKYTISDYESSSISVVPIIKCYQYVLFTTYSMHGLIGEGRLNCTLCKAEKSNSKIWSIKMLTLKELAIGTFMYDVYLTLLEKYIYHIQYVHILSNNLCGRLQHDVCYSKPGNICTIRDYTQRMSANFDLKIQSDYFGNDSSSSIEEYSIEVFDKYLNDSCELYSHFSDDNRQDISTTYVYMIAILEEL